MHLPLRPIFRQSHPEFYQRTHRVRLKNLNTDDKKILSQNQAHKDSKSNIFFSIRQNTSHSAERVSVFLYVKSSDCLFM